MHGQASKISRGLRTVGNNIANLAQQQKTLALETQNGTKEIQLFDETTGDMKNTYQIMEQIAKEWGNMNNAQKQAIAISLSGKNQFETFTSVIGNFANAQKAVTLATNSMGSAEQENARYMESLEAKITALKTEFQNLVLGEGGLHDVISAILTLGINILKFANSDIGNFIIKTTALVASVTLAVKGFQAFGVALKGLKLVNIIKSIADLIVGYSGLATAEGLATYATEAFTGALMANPIGLVLTAVTALTVGMIALAKHIQDSEENMESIHEEAVKTKDEIEKLTNSVKDLKDKLKDIENKKLNVTDEGQLKLLEQEEQSLRNQLAIEQEKLRIKKEQASEDAKKSLKKTLTFATDTGDGFSESKEVTRAQGLQEYINLLKSEQEELDGVTLSMAQLSEAGRGNSEEYKKLEQRSNELKSSMLEQKETANTLAGQLNEEANALDRSADASGKYDQEARDLYNTNMKAVNSWNDYTQSANNATNANGEATTSIEEYENEAESETEAL